jgi:hypothetical protein
MLQTAKYLALALLALAPEASSFALNNGCRSFGRLSTAIHMSDDFPSDSSVEALYEDATDAVFDVESRGYEETSNENLINSVLNELPLTLPSSGDLSKEARGKINEALLSLEALNPTEQPTESPLLNGVWTLRYAAGYANEWALPSPTR